MFIVGVEVMFLLLQCNLLPCLCVLALVVALSVLFFSVIYQKILINIFFKKKTRVIGSVSSHSVLFSWL